MRRRSRRAALRRVLRRPRRRSAAAARRPRARPRGVRLPAAGAGARSTRGRSGAHLELARSVAGAVDGDEGRRQVAVVRRGHGGRAGEAARLHRALSRDRPPPRHGRRRLRARVGRLPARAAGRQPEDRRGRAQVRGDRQRLSPTWCSNSAARCRASTATGWCAARSSRRCSGRSSTRRSARVKRTFDPDGLFNPGKIVDAPPLTSNLRYGAGYRTPDPATFFDFSEHGGMGRRRRDVQRPRRLPQDARRDDVPVVHGHAGREAFDPRPGQRAAPGDGGPPGRRRPRATTACTTCSTCASNAGPARRSARSASTWRGSRASFSPTTGSGTARRCARASSATSAGCREWGSRVAPLANAARRQRCRAMAQRAGPRHRPPPHAAGASSATRWSAALLAGRTSARPSATIRHPRPRPVVLFTDTFTNYNHPGDRRRRRRRARGSRRGGAGSRRMAAAAGR